MTCDAAECMQIAESMHTTRTRLARASKNRPLAQLDTKSKTPPRAHQIRESKRTSLQFCGTIAAKAAARTGNSGDVVSLCSIPWLRRFHSILRPHSGQI